MKRFTLVVALVLLFAACGDDATSSTTTTAEISDPFGPPFGLSATAQDFEFIPTSWTVPSGALLVVDFDNQGTVEHTFVVIKDRIVIESLADLDDSLIFRELEAGPGETASDTFQAPDVPGSYQVICTVPGHLEAGMTAELIVEN